MYNNQIIHRPTRTAQHDCRFNDARLKMSEDGIMNKRKVDE